MLVYLTKLVAPLLFPVTLSLIGFTVAMVLMHRGRRRLGWWCFAGAAVYLAVPSWPIASGAAMRALESRYPPRPIEAYPGADAIVVLGGGGASMARGRDRPEIGSSRELWAARLYRAGKAERVIVSDGGKTTLADGTQRRSADVIAALLEEFGVPGGAIVRETESRNTAENARYTAAIMRERGWESVLLVTHAFHMPRAVGFFEKQGLRVTAVPTDAKTLRAGTEFDPRGLIPSAGALRGSEIAIKEALSYALYKMLGRI